MASSSYVKKIPGRGWPLLNLIFLSLCVIAISWDPLFFYIPVIKDDKKCIDIDKVLGVWAVAVRSFLDFFHIFCIVLQLPPQLFAPCSEYQRIGRLTERKYLMGFFLIELLSILPLPQVVILIIITGRKLPNAMTLMTYFVIFQYVPRVIRIYPLFANAKRNSGVVAEASWVKAALNLLLFMLASHLFGALWYFFAIERETACWKKACITSTGCNPSFYCYYNLGDQKFINDFCSIEKHNRTIFYDAYLTGIVKTKNFPQKFLHCFRWGLQNLSCFGQNLQTSGSVGENFFAVVITISGIVLFLFLIGNMQIYLQSKTLRSEEMRLKAQEIERWMPFRKLSVNLQQQVRKYQRYVWRETRGVDVQNLLNNLPKDLKRNIMRELCLDLLKKVPLFDKLDEQHLDAMCDRLKPVLYTEESYVVREADPIDEMLFVMRGKLLIMSTGSRITRFLNSCYLWEGDFLGGELLPWALNPHSSFNYLPISLRTVKAVTEVEAFALMADDLKFICYQFRQVHRAHVKNNYRFYSSEWRTWGARFIQAAWRRYCKKKLEESLHEEENYMPQDANEIS